MLSKTNNIVQPLLADAFNHMRIKGCYFLVKFVARIDKYQQPFWEIGVSDASGFLNLYCRDESCIFTDLKPQTLVNIEAQIDVSGNEPYFRCKFIQLNESAIGQFKSLYQLPMALCPKPYALCDMLDMVNKINEPCLVDFVTNVLLQPSVGTRFLACPASLNYHHNYAGGLLVHSVEVAQNFLTDSNCSQQEKDLGIVAALLHDIGKTQTLTPDLTRTSIGYVIDHHQLTLELCAPALKILSTIHNGFAVQLRHTWTCSSPGSRYGFKAKTRVAKSLQVYDRQSAQ
jgi:3'-5' exoribonuclease